MLTGVTSADKCQELCQERQGCNYFTWVNSQDDVSGYRNTCWLKSTQGTPQASKTCVSGPRSCGGNPTTQAPSGCCETVKISSTGDAPDYQWTRFGTFRHYANSDDGRPMYRQDPAAANYLYYLEWLGVWYVNDNPLENMGGLINWGDAWCPSDIQEEWSFYRWGDGEVNDWEADPGLKVTCGENYGPTKPSTTSTQKSTPSTHTPNPNTEPCTFGHACDDCSVWAKVDGVRYCCASQCDWGDVFVWTENGQVQCECTH